MSIDYEVLNKLADKAQAAVRELAEELRNYDDMTAANIDALADEVERTIEDELNTIDVEDDEEGEK